MKRIVRICWPCIVTASLMWGDTIVDTFGPNDSYAFTGVTVGGGVIPRHDPPPNQGVTIALEFQPTFSATLDEIDLAVVYNGSPTGMPNLDVSIFSNANSAPGVPIEAIPLTDLNSTAPEVVSAMSLLHPLLNASTDYWLVIAPPDLLYDAFNVFLSPVSTGFIGNADRLGNAPWETFSGDTGGIAVRITGTPTAPTPESTTFSLLLGSLAFSMAVQRLSNTGNRTTASRNGIVSRLEHNTIKPLHMDLD